MNDQESAPVSPKRPSAVAAIWKRWRRAWRVVFGIIFLGALVGWGYVRLFGAVVARSHLVTKGDIAGEVFGRGTVESQREAGLGFDLVGRLSEVLVEEGTRVTMGQELARLAPEQVDADLRVAATGIDAARSSLGRIAADERRARAVLDAAAREGERTSRLAVNGIVSVEEAERAQDAVRLARAELDRALAQRGEATRAIELAGGGAEQRRVTVLRATLIAPFDGLVTKRLREPGDVLTVGTTVLRLVDTEQVYVAAWIDETLLGQIRSGQSARIRISGVERDIRARVTRVGWEADRQTHELIVDVTPNEPMGRIAIGQRADVWIEVERRSLATQLPFEYVLRDDRGAYCAVDSGGRVALRRIELGTIGNDAIEVRSGLEPGETVLTGMEPGRALTSGRAWRAP